MFQSTPLREGRRQTLCLTLVTPRFNPRPYVRGDGIAFLCLRDPDKFQSTPLREGRRGCAARLFRW